MTDLLTPRKTDRAGVPAPGAGGPVPPTDGERLMRFHRRRDQEAFAEIVETHAALVWGVCSQVLRHRQDVEDAFQATFLILARKARSIHAADSVAGWLYRVAFRTALLARSRRSRRAESPLVDEPASADDQLASIARNEECEALLEEVNALPMRYRQPIVLCYLRGLTRRQAADELGLSPQCVKGRLARGTRLLRTRMVCRGAALSSAIAAVAATVSSAQASAAPALASHTAALASAFAWKTTAAALGGAAAKSSTAFSLAEKGLIAMTLTTAAKPAAAVLCACLVGGLLSAATAAGTPGDRGGGDAAVLLAAAESGDAAAGDVAGGEGPGEEDVAVTISADASATAKPSDENPFGAPASATQAPQDSDPFAAPDVAAAKAAPPKVVFAQAATLASGDATNEPADVLIEAPAGLPAPAIAPPPLAERRALNLRVQPAFDQFRFTPTGLTATPGASPATLKLEAEYWAMKGHGLQSKAKAIEAKVLEANRLQESGVQNSSADIMELTAEKELTLAEVKFCELNAQRVKDALRQVDAGALQSGVVGPRVGMLQRALNEQLRPSPELDVDGEFGPLTEQAVVRFQESHGMTADGVARADMLMALGIPPSPAALDVRVPAMQAARAAEQSARAAVQGAAAYAAKAVRAAEKRMAAPAPQTRPRTAAPAPPVAEQNRYGSGRGGYGEGGRGGYGGGGYGRGEYGEGGYGGDTVVVPKQLLEKLEALTKANAELSQRVEQLQRDHVQREEEEER